MVFGSNGMEMARFDQRFIGIRIDMKENLRFGIPTEELKVIGQTTDGEVDGKWKSFYSSGCLLQRLSVKWDWLYPERFGLRMGKLVGKPT